MARASSAVRRHACFVYMGHLRYGDALSTCPYLCYKSVILDVSIVDGMRLLFAPDMRSCQQWIDDVPIRLALGRDGPLHVMHPNVLL